MSVFFGNEAVSETEKTARVRGVFNRVASRYDVMNETMSLGWHRVWKRQFVAEVTMRPHLRFLDVAGGTGDIAARLLARGAKHVTVCDINEMMLREGQARADDTNQSQQLTFICGNAEQLPFPDRQFDLYTIAFGIRNVTRIEEALKEAWRVLAPGGRFMCLEFSKVTQPLLARAYDAYSFQLIPKLGEWIAQDEPAYRYLVESIRQFPDAPRFSAMIGDAGFAQVRSTPLSGGIVAIHSGYRI